MRKTVKHKGKTLTKRRKLSKRMVKGSVHKKHIKTSKTKKRRRRMRGGEEEKEEECPICLEDFSDPNNAITLTCNHKFHKTCMKSTCESKTIVSICFCPLCRKQLSQQEIQELGVVQSPLETPTYNFPPYLSTIDDFKTYINNKLRAPTRQPLEVLNRELFEFLGTDSLPFEIFDKIMEFDLEQIATLNRYRFIGIVQNAPYNRGNKKYFVFTDHNDETGEDGDVAWDVYEV